MTIAGLPCPPIPGWLTQFGSGCFIREDYSVNGEVQPSVFAIFYSWQAMYSTNSWQVRQFMIVVDLVFHREGILKFEVWNRLEAVQRSLWGSDKWAADYVTNIQLKINQSLHDGEQLTPSEKKNCRDRWDQGAFKNLARSIIFSLRKQTFLTLCAECYIYPPILYVFSVYFFAQISSGVIFWQISGPDNCQPLTLVHLVTKWPTTNYKFVLFLPYLTIDILSISFM